MFLIKAVAAVSLIACTIASPIDARESNAKIVKRAEGVHLVNCSNNYSAVIFCSNDSDCNFNPGAGNQCLPTNGGVDNWEGSNMKCTFPGTGTTFNWNIQGNAQAQSNFVQVGSGDNGFHKFNIFKDDKHVMYTDGHGNQCRSIYYCLDA